MNFKNFLEAMPSDGEHILKALHTKVAADCYRF
jgi:hypothetical protein